MPIVLKRIEKGYSIAIWESIESFDELLRLEPLNEADLVRWNVFQSDKRKREWITVRVLLRDLFAGENLPAISYNEFGKPSLSNNVGISISHTKEFVAILINPNGNAGIDLETMRERITVLAPKFVNDEEQKFLPEKSIVDYLHVIWGAKEVMFKLNGRGELDFRAHLYVEPFQLTNKGNILARISKQNHREVYDIYYELWNGMMLTYAFSGK